MTIEQIRAKLPIQVEITQEMIDEGRKHLFSGCHCVGFQVLRSVYNYDNTDTNSHLMSWGVKTGGFRIYERGNWNRVSKITHFQIGTMEDIDMMELRTPTTVTLYEYSLDVYDY